MNGSKVGLTVVAILLIAATPGIMESYLAWQQYPETRQFIIAWYVALAVTVIAAVGMNLKVA